MQEDKDVLDLARLVQRAGHLLSESLSEYRPTEDRNLLGERNLSLHLGMALHEAGYKCFAECHWEGEANRRLDLVALHPYRQVLVLVECKGLFRAEGCSSMIADFERIRNFRPRYDESHDPKNVCNFKRIGVLLANSWEGPIARWWSSKDADQPSNHEAWNKFRKLLSDDHRGSVVIEGMHPRWKWVGDDRETHYLLYSVFPVDINDKSSE